MNKTDTICLSRSYILVTANNKFPNNCVSKVISERGGRSWMRAKIRDPGKMQRNKRGWEVSIGDRKMGATEASDNLVGCGDAEDQRKGF